MLRHASPRGSPPGRCHAFVKTEADLGDLGADETWMSCLGPAGGDPDGQAANTGGGPGANSWEELGDSRKLFWGKVGFQWDQSNCG